MSDIVKLVKDDAVKMVSNFENIEKLKAEGWTVEGQEIKDDEVKPSRGRPKKGE